VATPSGELTLAMKRVLPAARSVVYEAFCDPSELEVVGAGGLHHPEPGVRPSRRRELSDRDAAAGGRLLLSEGGFREVDPPARLAYTFIWEDPDPHDVETLVALAFRDLLREATEAALTQRPFKTEARRALHRDGWTDSFDKLERLISA
jgi:uncharacterized protein YndB with AHSA1/START domain